MNNFLGNKETLVELPEIDYTKNVLEYEFVHDRDLIPEEGVRDSLNDVILDRGLKLILG